ncbi:MAG: hydroxymethylglutaryl-CoA reductase, degradative [Thermoplasmatota archaeon]
MSTWSGFHRLDLAGRRDRLKDLAGLLDEELAALVQTATVAQLEPLIENVVATYVLPLGIAGHFVVDGESVAVPMVVEESSVVAAASHGAKLAAANGGFRTEIAPPITIGQVELRDVADQNAAQAAAAAAARGWVEQLNSSIPSMVTRGGGVRAIQARPIGDDRLVLHLHVDCRDAMGANLVNSLCERLGPLAAEALGARLGLRILSNLADQRLATARCTIPAAALGGPDAVAAIVEANDFALLDPYRAATHNKGILNGIDPVVVATGNDWRAIEAGAHAYAARDGAYRALTRYRVNDEGDLEAELSLPLSLGTVGGVTRLHPTARAAMRLLGDPDSTRLAAIVASVGLAQNVAALKALAGEGIQRGHMSLHARNLALAAGLAGDAAAKVAERMVAEGNVSAGRARELAAQAGQGA